MRSDTPSSRQRLWKASWQLVVVGFVLCMISGCAVAHHYDAIEGKVIDLETGQPIAGAAVHASYFTTFYNMIDPTSWYLNSQETLTNDKGEFVIPAQWVFTFRPMNLFNNDVDIIIFKPDYSCYGNSAPPSPKLLEGRLNSNQKTLVGLNRLITEEEKKLHSSCVPPDGSYPLLLKLLNIQRDELGIPRL